MLVIDCCIRGELSTTRRYYQAYLEASGKTDVQILELSAIGLAPLDFATLQKRDALCAKKQFDHELFALARQFQAAEEILIAAPYWDLSFPSLLKVYLEHIMVSGLTFGYQEDGRCIGYCKAETLRYFSSCGGYCSQNHLGFAYVKALCAMVGIPHCVPYFLEGMDIDPSQRENILEKAIQGLSQENA